MATAYRAIYLARPDGHFYGRGAWQPLTPGLSGQPTHLTVCRPWKQDPGSSLGPALRLFGARSTEEEEEKYVHVCDMYVHVCDVYVHVCDVYVHVCDVYICACV